MGEVSAVAAALQKKAASKKEAEKDKVSLRSCFLTSNR